MLYSEVNAAEAFLDADGFGHKKIGTSSFEDIVLLLGNNEYYITSLLIWMLIGLSMENELLSVR